MFNSMRIYLSRTVSAEYRKKKSNWSRLSEEAVMKEPSTLKAYKRGTFLRFFSSDAISKAIWILRTLDIHSTPIFFGFTICFRTCINTHLKYTKNIWTCLKGFISFINISL